MSANDGILDMKEFFGNMKIKPESHLIKTRGNCVWFMERSRTKEDVKESWER